MYSGTLTEGLFPACSTDRTLIEALSLLSTGPHTPSLMIPRILDTWSEDVEWLLDMVRTRLRERGIEVSVADLKAASLRRHSPTTACAKRASA